MDMAGEQRIPAKRETVWAALNDPAILEACIPGCQELIKSSDTQMTAIAVIKVGPVKAKFQGAVTLSDLDPPNGYRITGEGQGGVAGFAKGTAVVRLEDDGDATILHYEVSADVGGKLSQLGGRLIDATAKQMSGAFFKRFAEEIDLQYGGNENGNAAAESAAPTRPSASPSLSSSTVSRPQPVRRVSRTPAASDASQGLFGSFKFAGVVLLLVALAGAWYLFGGRLPNLAPADGAGGHVSPDFANAVQLLIVAAIGYLFGRQRKDSDTIRIDREVLDALTASRRQD